MNMIRYSPFSRIAHRGEEMRQVFERFFGDADNAPHRDVSTSWTPRVDIREEADRFLILADVPGIDPGDIEIDMDNGVLSIRGERVAAEAGESDRLTRIERRHGAFNRRFALPDSVDADAISASGRHGVLEIVIPKRAETKPRRIQVKPSEIGA